MINKILDHTIERAYPDVLDTYREYQDEILKNIIASSDDDELNNTLHAGIVEVIPEVVSVISVIVNVFVGLKISRLTVREKELAIEKIRLELELKKIDANKQVKILNAASSILKDD